MAKVKGVMPQEGYVDAAFPIHGLDISKAFSSQTQLTTIQGVNVRTFEPLSDRGRGGSRPGLSKYVAGQVPAGTHLVQHLNYVVDPSADALLDSGPDFSGSVTQDPNHPGWWFRTGGTGIQPNKNRKITPLISWATPADITQGTALSSTQLNAQAYDPRTLLTIPGNYTYKPVSGTVLNAGNNQKLTVSFAPSDTNTFRSGAGSVLINVTSSQFVQSKSNNVNGSLAFTSNVTSGNLIVVILSPNAPGQTITGVSDSLGSSYTLLDSVIDAGTGDKKLWFWYGFAASSGACTVSYTGTGFASVIIGEYSGIKNTSSVDNNVQNTSYVPSPPYADTATTTPVTISGSNEVLIGAFYTNQIQNNYPTTTFNQREFYNISGFSGIYLLDQLGPAAGSLAVTLTETLSIVDYSAIGVSFNHA